MSESHMRKQALLIGINNYQYLPVLKYARQDAEAIEIALKRNYGFSDDEVVLLTDAKPGGLKPSNREKILYHLRELANQNLDLFIFGFWGHGLFCNGKRYLCPLDVTKDSVEEQGFSFFDLQQLLANIRANNTCMILDCCQNLYSHKTKSKNADVPIARNVSNLDHSEALTSADQTVMEDAARDIILKRKKKEPEFDSNVAILNSCKEGQSAYEWEERKHGIFTAHLLDAMNCRCNKLFDLVSYVSSAVEKTARDLGKKQTPFYKLEGNIDLPAVDKPKPLPNLPRFIIETDNSADAVIQKSVIKDIKITVTPKIIDQGQHKIQYKEVTLPSKPKDLLNIPAENEALLEAIEQLKAMTHESLAQANEAVAQAQAQLDAWTERREERWSDLPETTRKSWKRAISKNPDCKVEDVIIQGDLSNQEYRVLVENFQCGKKYLQAKLELERLVSERKTKCDEAVEKLQQKIEDNKRRYMDCSNNFFDEVLLAILGSMPGYDDLKGEYPEDVNTSLEILDDYQMGWREENKISRARWVWDNRRPCVIKNKKWEERKRKWKKLIKNIVFVFWNLVFALITAVGISFIVKGMSIYKEADSIKSTAERVYYPGGYIYTYTPEVQRELHTIMSKGDNMVTWGVIILVVIITIWLLYFIYHVSNSQKDNV